MPWTERQVAMLQEIGLRVWQPPSTVVEETPVQKAAPAVPHPPPLG